MRKPIPTTVHGVLDYMTAGLLFALPRVMGWSRRATNVLDTAAIGAVGYSLLTRYELGAVKVLPMKAHLAMDAASGAGLIGAAAMMDDEAPDVRMTIAGLGAFEIAAALLSQTRPRPKADTYETGREMFDASKGRGEEQSMPAASDRLPVPASVHVG